MPFDEVEITRAILDRYHEQVTRSLAGDVAVIGAGPSGLVAAGQLAKAGVGVTVFEKRLAPGGGVWGGGMGMAVAVVQEAAVPVLREMGIRYLPAGEGLYTVDAIELAGTLCVRAVQAGAVLLNLTVLEDVIVHQGRVAGVVVNRTPLPGALPVDPVAFPAKVVIDATGHDAAGVEVLRRRGLLGSKGGNLPGEGPMDAAAGEAFVAENVAEVYPGLWVCGMSVCATFGGPRMGPIFGGMLMSGRRVAECVLAALQVVPGASGIGAPTAGGHPQDGR
jgi:thiamine thiazole synthase